MGNTYFVMNFITEKGHMTNFFKGIMYWVRGFQALTTDGLKRFIILPIGFNLLFFSGLFYVLYHYLLTYTNYYVDKLPSWLGFLSWIFFILFLIGFIALFLLLFTVILTVIAAPFNGLLAEKTQKLLYHSTIPSQSFTQIALRTIKRQGQFLSYFLPRLLVMGLLFFVPLIQPIYPVLWFIFAAWMLSMQYQDFAMDNNLIDFHDMKQKIKDKPSQTLGFGLIINLISIIPIFNILVMPAAVIGSVIFYCEEHKSSSQRLIVPPSGL